MRGFDAATVRSLAAGEVDTRAWVTYGLVDADTASGRSVLFNDESGNPLPWPTVLVTLQPSGVQVACRVLSTQSGSGEGHWRPFVAGDEVLVGIPGGDERSGCVILGRLTQGRDAFPPMVAGNDVTQNTTAFDRFIPPYILESGTAIMLRIPTTGSFLSMDAQGNITMANGNGDHLALNNDMLSMTSSDTTCIVQINQAKKQVYLQAGAGGTNLLLDSAGASQFLTAGSLKLQVAGGGYPLGFAVNTQQVVVLIEGVLTALSLALLALGATPLTGASLGALISPAALPALAALGITKAAALTLTAELAALTAAIQVPPVPGATLVTPGVGRAALLY